MLCKVEDETATAQVDLANLSDHTMSRIYQSYGYCLAKTHWFSEMLNKGATSKSNFYKCLFLPSSGAKSHSEHTLPFRSPDFLSFAFSNGLFRYVVHWLDCKEENISIDTINHLLCCSVWSLDENWVQPQETHVRQGSFALISYLLRRGGNPNIEVVPETM